MLFSANPKLFEFIVNESTREFSLVYSFSDMKGLGHKEDRYPYRLLLINKSKEWLGSRDSCPLVFLSCLITSNCALRS